jgi:protein-L-isoaspartate(D-aspartate) O-methyltransferase
MVASIVPALCISFLIFHGCAAQKPEDAASVGYQTKKPSGDEFQDQRRRMVERQIRERGIKNQAVLEAMMKVPRHRFVTAENMASAYEDHPLPIGQGQTISQPYIVAYMTEAAEISDNEKVLEIGTGSGYQAAILGELAKEVYTIEIIPELAERARRTLGELGYQNVRVKTGNGYAGWAEYAPYDGIVVTAAPDEVPKALIDQLAMNGKMVIPVGVGDQEMMIITKTAEGVIEKRTIPVRFVPMTGKPKK